MDSPFRELQNGAEGNKIPKINNKEQGREKQKTSDWPQPHGQPYLGEEDPKLV